MAASGSRIVILAAQAPLWFDGERPGSWSSSTAGGPTYLRISRDDQQRFGDGCRETTGALPARRLPAPGPAKTTVIPASRRCRAPRQAAAAATAQDCRRRRRCGRAGRAWRQGTSASDRPGVTARKYAELSSWPGSADLPPRLAEIADCDSSRPSLPGGPLPLVMYSIVPRPSGFGTTLRTYCQGDSIGCTVQVEPASRLTVQASGGGRATARRPPLWMTARPCTSSCFEAFRRPRPGFACRRGYATRRRSRRRPTRDWGPACRIRSASRASSAALCSVFFWIGVLTGSSPLKKSACHERLHPGFNGGPGCAGIAGSEYRRRLCTSDDHDRRGPRAKRPAR